MHIIIIGCGRVGARLASLLTNSGHSVVVIDKNAQAFERLGPSFRGTCLVGIGFDRKVLLKAGIERADALVAVTNGDNSNVVAASIAVDDFHVPRVVARIADPVRAEMFAKLGITTISSTPWTSARIYELITSPELFIDEREELSFNEGRPSVSILAAAISPKTLFFLPITVDIVKRFLVQCYQYRCSFL